VDDRRIYLKGLLDSLRIPDAQAHVSVGRPTSMLVEFIDSIDDPIVVMASHGRESPERGAVGRHTLRLIHHLAVPLVVVKHPDDGGVLPDDGIHRVIVPLDGSGFSERALEASLTVLGEPAPPFHLVSVIDHNAGDSTVRDAFVSAARDAHADRLDEVARRLTDAGLTVTWEVRAGEPEVEIAMAAVDSNASMIAMSTHGRGGIANALIGSVAEGVLHRCHHPLLLIRPDEE
jgi:nucleotide-binding universal stress UspA family protein